MVSGLRQTELMASELSAAQLAGRLIVPSIHSRGPPRPGTCSLG